jgi:hypothetical protein
MNSRHFDTIVQSLELSSRRAVFTALARGALGMLLAGAASGAVSAGGGRRNKKKKKNKENDQTGSPPPSAGPSKGLRETCVPGQDTCSAGLQCSTPTTRHTCSSTVQGVSAWCCVPPGGSCTECDCCGDNYCEFDDNNRPRCVPNPEG